MEEARERSYIDLFHQSIPIQELIGMHRECTHVIGLDIGGGNFSAKDMNIAVNEDEKAPEIGNLYVDDDFSSKLYAMVGYDYAPDPENPDSFVILKKYVGVEAQGAMAFFTNFKAVPTQKNLSARLTPDNDLQSGFSRTRRELIRDAVGELFAKIRRNKSSLQSCDPGKILLVVGIPSSEAWKREKENYLALIREATGVREVLSISESSAAVLYMTEKFRSQASGSILIVDLGAFSADITYLDRTERIPLEMSVELGGRQVDRAIGRCAIQKAKEICPDGAYAADDLSIRLEKEKHWPGAKGNARFVVRGMSSPVELTPQEMEACVTQEPVDSAGCGPSYTQELAAFIGEFHRRNPQAKVDVVLIVGGASNMKPAYDAVCRRVREIWTNAEIYPQWAQIEQQDNDECVSYGVLDYYAKAMAAANGMQELENELRACLKDNLFPVIAKNLSQKLTPLLNNPQKTGLIDQTVLQWAQEEEDTSAKNLGERIELAIRNSEEIRQVIRESASPEDYARLAKDMSVIITDFVRKLYQQDAQQESEQSRRILANLEGLHVGLSDTLIPIVIQAIETQMTSLLLAFVILALFGVLMTTFPGLVLALGAMSAIESWVIKPIKKLFGIEGAPKKAYAKEAEKKLSQGKRREYAQKLSGKSMAEDIRCRLQKTDYLNEMLDGGKFDGVIRQMTGQLRREIEKAVYQ